MKIVESRFFAGINIHCYKPVLEAIVDLEALAGKSTSQFPEFAPALVGLMPGLKEHVCGIGRRGGFWLRLRKGTYFGHVVEHVAIELLNMAGYQASYGKTRAAEKEGLYTIVIQCQWPKSALLALSMAITLTEELLRGEGPEQVDIAPLEKQLLQEMPGPSTQAIIDAARSRGIPVKLMEHGSLLRLGTGKYRQFVAATITGRTPCIGVDIACDKTLTKKILAEAMIPTPRGAIARDEEHALEIARELGGMVVVKPADGNQGKGVSLNLQSEAEIRSAYKVAQNYSAKILVEEQIFGRHYRILVVNNRVEAVSERFPARVVGDGIHSIKDLIEIENRNPLRGEEHEKPLTKIKVDQVVFNVLARQNLTMNYVPQRGEEINLRDNANLSTGGTAADVTDDIHEENKILACRIARLLDLDVAGIDVVTEDIAQPLLAGRGAVIEVNAAPGIRMHLFPARGQRRPVGDAIVDYLFPWQRRHSIPLLSVTGTNGKTTTSRLIAHAFSRQGKKVGLACTDGIYIDGICINAGDNTGPVSADVVLSDPAVEVAVLETARGGLVRKGLGYTEADVAVVTNISSDHLGCDGINTLEELCHVKSLVVETVRPDGYAILNADDELVLAMAAKCPGQIIMFSLAAQGNRALAKHLAAGGRGVIVEDGAIVLVEGNRRDRLAELGSVPITFGGRARYNVANCLAAAGALWGMGMEKEDIAAGLCSFDARRHNPGRTNIYDLGTCRVILDYGHNYEGYRHVFDLMNSMVPQRKVGVVGVPGDRRDADIIAVGKLCGQQLDCIYIKEDQDLRGRKRGEVAGLLRRGIEQAERKPQVEEIYCEREALESAVSRHQPGDLIVVFYERLDALLSVLEKFN